MKTKFRSYFAVIIVTSLFVGCAASEEEVEIDDDAFGKADAAQPEGTYFRTSAPMGEILTLKLRAEGRRFDIAEQGRFGEDWDEGSYRLTMVGDRRFIKLFISWNNVEEVTRYEYKLANDVLQLRKGSAPFVSLQKKTYEFCHSPYDGCAQIRCDQCESIQEEEWEGNDCSIPGDCVKCSPWTEEDGDPNEPCE